VLKHYIIQALRSFWRFRVTAVVNLLGLSLALVCFIATYLFLDSLLRNGDRQFSKAQRTYALTEELWTTPTNRMIPAFPESDPGVARYLRADLPRVEAIARALNLGTMAATADDRGADLFVAAVDPEFLKIFDLKPLEGQLRDALGSTHSVIITASAALRLFGTRNVVGRPILLQNQAQVTVSAVIDSLPAGSHMGEGATALLRFDLLLPMDFLKTFQSLGNIGVPANPDNPYWGNDAYFTYVLLPDDGSVTPAQLQETLRAFPARHISKDQMLLVLGAVPLTHIKLAALEALGGNHAPLAASAFLLDALILAIACLNYANLTVAIATTRAREIGMRKVLGASRLHLTRQYLIEAALLGGAALILVLIGTALAVPAIDRAFALDFHAGSLLRPALWSLVIALLAIISLVGGAYPALVLARVRPIDSLRAATVRAGPRFVPTVLVGVQFAAASFLLVVALMMSAQNHILRRMGIRPDRDPVVVIDTDIRQIGVPFESLRNELLRDPNIRAVSTSVTLPWQNGGWHQTVSRSPNASASAFVAMVDMINYDFFRTAGIDIVAGRDFDREHADPTFGFGPQRGVPSGIVDRALAKQLGWPRPEDAVEQTIYLTEPWNSEARGQPIHVVGVVENGYPRLVGPNADSNLYLLSPRSASVPLIRIPRDHIPGALARIDTVWKELSPKVPLRRRFMDELFNSAYETYATLSGLLSSLSVCAFVIAIAGLIGMAIHITSRRLHEIGIRKTLGASARGVVLMLLRDFSKPVLIANILAWPFAFVAGRLYFNMFTQRAPLSAEPYVLSLVVTLFIAWVAVAAQALRAAAVKPANVLRMD
jgi:putative ABC transport system permease protein